MVGRCQWVVATTVAILLSVGHATAQDHSILGDLKPFRH